MKNDRSKKLFDAVNGIGDDLIDEAASYDAKRERARKIRRYGAVAATFVIIAAVAVMVIMKQNKNNIAKDAAPAEPIVFGEERDAASAGSALPAALRNVKVRASESEGKIIGTGDSFIVETAQDCDVDVLTDNINISPKTNVSITKKSPGSFEIAPASGKLFPGTLYNISFGDPDNPVSSYTFQTENEFFVKSVLPANEGTNVPVNTGIEITFSDAVGDVDFEDYISVEPSVGLEFKLYPSGRVLAAVPTQDLEYGTVYKVTVGKGIASLSGKVTAEDTIVTFRTELDTKYASGEARLYIATSKDRAYTSYNNYRYSFNGEDYIFSSGDALSINYSLYYDYEDLKSCKVSAILYRYPDTESAARAVTDSSRKVNGKGEVTFSTKGLMRVGEFEGSETTGDYYDRRGTLSFGTGLDNGFYLAKIHAEARNKYGDKTAATKFVVLQVSDLRAFTISSDGKTLVRVDRVGDGPVSGAEVFAASFNRSWFRDEGEKSGEVTSSAVTEKGVCTIENGEYTSSVITVEKDGDAIILCNVCSETDNGKYGMSYVYTDREKYFSNDTVNFSGFAILFDGTVPKTLYVRTSDSPAEEIEVAGNGYFKGSYKIEDRSEGGIYVSIVDGEDTVVASKYIKITEEEKPQITAKITFDKLFYRFGETVTATVKATFFDGTPAEGFEFTLNSYPFGGGFDAQTTDKNGEISYTFETGIIDDPWSTDPSKISVSAELTGLESQTLYVSSDVYYFHSDYVFKTIWETTRRALTLNKVDTSKLLSEDDLKPDVFPKNTVGGPADGSVSYSLKKYEIIKKEHKSYDYNAKRNYTYYTYDTKTTTVDSGTMTFEDGVIELPAKKVVGFTGGYYYEIYYNDGRNTYEAYVSATDNPYVRRYDSDEYSVTLDREKYGAGDTFSARFEMNGVTLGDVLFAACANGIEKYGVTDVYTDKFESTMITGCVLYAVAFDADAGAYFFDSTNIAFDPAESALEVELEPDKDVYSPGEKATVKVKVKDAPSATVVLSVVDEACFALEEQNEDSAEKYFSSIKRLSKNDREIIIYGSWYGYDYYGYYGSGRTMKSVTVDRRFSCSETVYGPDYDSDDGVDYDGAVSEDEAPTEAYNTADVKASGLGRGSGGEEEEVYVRTNFADNPVYTVAQLDETGAATVVFTVPDNITSWRITAIASDGTDGEFDKVRLGNAVTDLICTKDFFINLSAPSYYITGDDAALLARSYGTASDGEVKYEAVVTDEAGDEVATVSASDDSKGYAELNFGKLDEGHYTATVYGRGKNSSDALTAEFDVIKSAEIMPERRTVTPGEIKDISPALYPVTLTFYDADASRLLYGSLVRTLSYGDSIARADMLAAKYASLVASSRVFGEDVDERLASVKEEFKDYCKGLVSLLSYSEGDEELTAQIMAIAPEIVGSAKSTIVSSLYDKISSSVQTDEATFCAALSALASAGEPVLDTLYKTAGVAGNYPTDAKLYLASAFAAAGDWSAASDIYGQVAREIGERKAEYGTMCLRGKNDDETIRLTSLALLTASRCARDDAAPLAKYLVENRSKTEPVYIPLASYVRYFMSSGEYAEKNVTYSVGGVESSETLTPWNTFSLRLSKRELSSFEIVSIDDGVGIDASYLAPAYEVLQNYNVSDRVTISKEIEPYMNGLYKVNLTVSGTSTRVSECFDLTDVVPSGARFFASYNNTSSYDRKGNIYTGAYVFNSAAQKIGGHVWVWNDVYSDYDVRRTECPEYSFSVTVSYVIRAAVKGEFIVEPAVVRNLGADVYYASERHTITIGEDGWTIEKKY